MRDDSIEQIVINVIFGVLVKNIDNMQSKGWIFKLFIK